MREILLNLRRRLGSSISRRARHPRDETNAHVHASVCTEVVSCVGEKRGFRDGGETAEIRGIDKVGRVIGVFRIKLMVNVGKWQVLEFQRNRSYV